MASITVNGVSIPRYEVTADLFLCKNTLILGESKTGKSVFTRHILNVIANTNKIPVGILFNGGESEDLNPFFISDLTQTELDEAYIMKLMQWQQERISIYRASMKLQELQSYFDKHVRNAKTTATIQAMNAEYEKVMRNPDVKPVERENIKIRFDEAKSSLLRLAVAAAPVDTKNLSNDEFAVYMGSQLNPSVLLAFDDVGNDISKLPKACRAFISFIYSKGRHQKYTTLMLLQYDTQLPKQDRSNAHQFFWTSQGAMQTSTAAGRGLFPKSIARQAQQIADSNFFVRTPGGEFRILGYDASQMRFFYVVSEQRESIKIASPALRELSSRVSSLTTKRTTDNNSLLRR